MKLDFDPSQFSLLLCNNLDEALEAPQLGNDCVSWLAECAKSSQARSDANSTGSIEKIILLLQIAISQNDYEFIKNCLRALANLCFDNDDNRDEILQVSGAIERIVSCLDIDYPQLTLTAFGALLNISMDNELVQNEMVQEGLMARILIQMRVLQNGIPNDDLSREIICMAMKVASSVLESDSGIQEFIDSRGLLLFDSAIKLFGNRLSQTNSGLDPHDYSWIIQAMDAIGVVLETISTNDEIQLEIANSSALETIMDFVEQKPNAFPDWISLEEPNLESIKLVLSKVVCAVTMSDKNMKLLVGKTTIIDRFKAWTMLTGHSVKLDDEIRMSGSLCLGNIARSDETCALLLKQNIVGPLLNLIKVEAARLKNTKEEFKLLIKVMHGALGTIKNLSLAPGTKAELGKMNVIKILVDLFDIELLQPLHVTLISTIKNLCMGDNDLNVYRTLTGLEPNEGSSLKDLPAPSTSTKSPIGKIVRITWNTSKEIDSGVKSEAGRLIANIVKVIHRTNAKSFLPILFELHCVTLLVQILTGAHLTKNTNLDEDAPHSDHHVQFDAVGESTRVFPIVQNESVVALTLLCSMHPPTANTLKKFEAIPLVISKILASPFSSSSQNDEESANSHSIHTKMNVLLLIRSLPFKDIFLNESRTSLITILKALINTDDAAKDPSTVEFQFQAAVTSLLKEMN